MVDDLWGVALDLRWRINDRWGCSGEVFTGQTLGTYGGGVFQNVNSATFEPVHATGGWGQVDYYFTPCLHSHFGAGLDDPLDSELAPGQIGQNRTFFANLIWDLNQSLRIAGELTFRDTNYIGPAPSTTTASACTGKCSGSSRKLCDQHKTKAKIVEALAAGKW